MKSNTLPKILYCVLGVWSGAALAALPETPVALETTGDYQEGALLVKFKSEYGGVRSVENAPLPGITGVESLHAKAPRNGGEWTVARLQPGIDPTLLTDFIANQPEVATVELDHVVRLAAVPSDPYFPEQWNLHNSGQTGGVIDADVDAPEAWNIATGSANVVVAVIDTGVDYTHEDIKDNMWTNPGEIPGNGIDDDANGYVDDVYGYDFFNNTSDPFDDNGHGTHVAGTIAARGNNSVGVVGIAWRARVMAVKFLSAGGFGYVSDAVRAVRYATTMGAKVANNSWGGGGYNQALFEAISDANTAGMLFVAAAGNAGSNNDFFSFYPANYNVPNVLAVAATDHYDLRAWFSNYGATTVALGAPGVNVLSSVPRGFCSLCAATGYRLLSGTSMAAPHVSGAAALLLSHGGFGVADIKPRLIATVDPVEALNGITLSGGRLNVYRAVNTPGPQPLPDLVIEQLQGSGSAVPGALVAVTATLKNVGLLTASSAMTALILSKDVGVSADDIPVGRNFQGAIEPGGARQLSITFLAPRFIPPGTYYLLAKTDYGDATKESDETNNVSNAMSLLIK